MKHSTLFHTLVFLLFALCARGQALWDTLTPYPKEELRAVWLTTLGGLDWPKTKTISTASRERQQRELCDLLDQLKSSGINTILFQTRIRGSVIYPSSIEPWDIALTGQYGQDPGYDPLAFAIREAHLRGMELHAWVVSVPAFKTDIARKMGPKSLFATHPKLLRKHSGMYYLDPGEPATAEYIASICAEIAGNYDVDGIHLDYIRYPEQASSFPDGSTYSRYGKGQAKADWRRSNVTHIVEVTRQAIRSLKPWLKVSCSPVGKYRDTRRYSSRGWNAYDAVYQDAKAWLRLGYMDMLFPMMYFTGDHFYPFLLDWGEGNGDRLVAPGLGIYFLSPKEKDWDLSVITRELQCSRSVRLGGQAFFRASFLTDNVKGLRDYLSQSFYAFPALVPSCPWLDSEPPTAPASCSRADVDSQMTELTWQSSTDNLPEGGVRYNVYASPSWPVDVSRAENLVATYLSEPHYSYNRLLGLNLAITAIDRCGNESEALQAGGGYSFASQSEGQSLHYMPHDGQSLSLPPMPEAEYYMVTDLIGRTILTGKWAEHVDISSLPRGIYRLRTLQKRGVSRPVGEFRK
ncbi:MAG: family 10 glycosylhydrolase [Prevotellaceae bacterium]|nr:family 10 glycosylhydrolase [Prevotellaceae bacterium]